jgi:LacI family transcriptional regulator
MSIPKVILRFETSRACGRGILLGVSKYCNLFSRWDLKQKAPFYLSSHNQIDDSELPESWAADGMIIDLPDIILSGRKKGVAVIGIDIREPVQGVPNIVPDDYTIAQIALTHFIDRGFFQLAFCGFEGIHWSFKRGKHFVELAEAQGLHVAEYQIKNVQEAFFLDEALLAITGWLKNLTYPLGLLACNDDCGKIVSTACESAGIRIPEDIALLGVDNDEMVCLPNSSPLSSIVQNFEKSGFEAAELLDRIMKGQEKLADRRIVIQSTHVVARHSTDILATDDPEITTALQYIRQNINQPIGIPDVVAATMMSRRALEYRFQKVLGRSIGSLIRSQRTARISKLLIETNLTISQIANELGYTSAEHIARYFRREKGMSPSEFRNTKGNLQMR